MVISGTLAIIATTATIFGLVNTGANVAGAVHDKAMINESIQNMEQTQQLLQQKAQNATGENKQEMLVAANKLKQVSSRMNELNAEAYTSALRNEAAGLAKGLAASVGGVGKLGEVVENAVGVGETTADQFIGNQSLSNVLGNAEMDRWQSATKAGDSLDVQILILQARELAKKTKELNSEMQRMKNWYENEKLGNTDSSELDQMAVDLIANNPELPIEPVPVTDTQGSNGSVPNDKVDPSDPKSGIGLDFLNFDGYGKKVEMFYDYSSLNEQDESLNATSIKSIKNQWDAFGNDLSNMSIEMMINKDNSVIGTMTGVAFINADGYSERIVDLSMNGTFNPGDKSFEGEISGNLIEAAEGVAKGSPQTTTEFLKKYNNSTYKDKLFTFKGYVDEENRTIYGNFFLLHFWRAMEGEY